MSKGRYVAKQSLAETIYWTRTYTREIHRTSWYPNRPTNEQQHAVVNAAWERAEAIAARYQRMKKRAKKRARPLPMDGTDFHHEGEV
jgi:hypothetical protein